MNETEARAEIATAVQRALLLLNILDRDDHDAPAQLLDAIEAMSRPQMEEVLFGAIVGLHSYRKPRDKA